jgi:UDP-glucuronate 4-epimerase
MAFISMIEKALGPEATKNFLPMQNDDVVANYSDVDDFWRNVGFDPATLLTVGVRAFVKCFGTR